jgi:hypothetical protein
MVARVNLPVLTLSVLILSACLGGLTPSLAAGGYAMYVWAEGFDATADARCDEAKLRDWNTVADDYCYTHNWETAQSRQWLWDTANRPEREIDRLFVSDIVGRLQSAADPVTGLLDCSHSNVLAIKEMLRDGHCAVPGVTIYALLAVNDPGVSEQNHVKYVVSYNDNCAGAPNARFDGIAVNNEAWGVGTSRIMCAGPDAEQAYLDDLQAVADAADLQVNGSLATHYSIGFHWNRGRHPGDGDCPNDGPNPPHLVNWQGGNQPATHHMVDIFDSVDVQVATVNATDAARRAREAGYEYALGLGKPFYVLSFTNKGADTDAYICTTRHFPDTRCGAGGPQTEDDMMEVFDTYTNPDTVNGIPAALPAIHHFRGVYSTGGHRDWPSYYSGSLSLCIPPVTFANPVNDDEISWPAQEDATDFELARADTPTFVGCQLLPLTSERTSAVDTERPNPSSVFFYLVRVLAPEAGDWGRTSAGDLRSVSCP